MPVTVHHVGQRPEKSEHEHADTIAVDELGHLVVTAREGRGERVVAVHAPGTWAKALAD